MPTITGPDSPMRYGWEGGVLLGVLAFALKLFICWLLARRCVKREPFFWED